MVQPLGIKGTTCTISALLLVHPSVRTPTLGIRRLPLLRHCGCKGKLGKPYLRDCRLGGGREGQVIGQSHCGVSRMSSGLRRGHLTPTFGNLREGLQEGPTALTRKDWQGSAGRRGYRQFVCIKGIPGRRSGGSKGSRERRHSTSREPCQGVRCRGPCLQDRLWQNVSKNQSKSKTRPGIPCWGGGGRDWRGRGSPCPAQRGCSRPCSPEPL